MKKLPVLVVAGALVALAGCGSSDDSSGSAGTDSSTPSSSTSASYDLSAQQRAATWLAGQLDGGVAHNRQYKFDDYSLSADIAFGLHTVSGHDEDVRAVAKAVAANLKAYVAPGYGTLTSAGSAAKALVLGQDADADTDGLVATLERTVTTSGPSKGRIADQLDPKDKKATDYANVIGQSYAVQALAAAGSSDADEATDFLLEQQCSAGWFRVTFTADPKAADQTCDGDPKATPDPDATAFAVLALASLEDADDDVTAARDKAVAWLEKQQAANGSFSSAQPKVANANTTGMAGWALGTVGETEAAGKAATWVAQHQLGCDAGKAAGAIAYDDSSLAQTRAKGITVKTEGQIRLATAQALPVLRWLPVHAAPQETC
ncbi:prenyltransferase/squalene oxidase repeat-containing protein [Nocardioides sp. DS6]|uniref:Prenyltransferase/squalene oxidase repeat-containing protein n=1 Tax=Nocardioides eburneus TaxID=3231482 RepID=A0ABV3SXZ8_9ACTN